MSGISLQELDAQFSELLPEREALGCISHISLHCHPHHHHHCAPRPCEPRPQPWQPVRVPCPPVHHHCAPPPPPFHPKKWLPFAPKH